MRINLACCSIVWLALFVCGCVLFQDTGLEHIDMADESVSEIHPPAPVENLEAAGGNEVVILSWTTPPNIDLAVCQLHRLQGPYPPERVEDTRIITLEPSMPDNMYEYEDEDVINGETYSYTIFCANSAGMWQEEVHEGNTATATPSLGIPRNPDDLSATDGEDGQSTITLTIADPSIVFCDLERSDQDYPYASGDPLERFYNQGEQQFVDISLTNGTTYYYAVYCVNEEKWNEVLADGNSDTATPADRTPPEMVTDLIARPGHNHVVLEWTNPPDDDLHACMLRRVIGSSPPANREVGRLVHLFEYPEPSSRTVHVDDDVVNGTEYTYAVFCRDEADNWQGAPVEGSYVTTTAGDFIPPPVVTNLIAEPLESAIRLTWSNPTDQGLHMCLLRRVDGLDPPSRTTGVPIFESSNEPGFQEEFLDGDLHWIDYSYSVFCRDLAGNWQDMIRPGENTATARPHDTTPPMLIDQFDAQVQSETSIRLSWLNPPDPDLHSCTIRRAESGSPPGRTEGDWLTDINPAPPQQYMDYHDNNIGVVATYSYSIFCRDHAENWQEETVIGMNTVTVTMDTTPPQVVSDLAAFPGNQSVQLSWANPPDEDLHSCTLRRTQGIALPPQSSDGGFQVALVTNAIPHNFEQIIDLGLTNDTPYHYGVFCRDQAGNWQNSSDPTGGNIVVAIEPYASDPPSPVTDLEAGPGLMDLDILLTWTNPGEPTLEACMLRRNANPNAPPQNLSDGDLVTIIEPATAGMVEQHYDGELMSVTQYRYTVFCRDAMHNWQTEVSDGNTASFTLEN